MTRKSRRELERRIEDLTSADDVGFDVTVAYRTAEEWVDADGDSVPKDAEVALAYNGVTMSREKAEANDYTILEEDVDVAVDEEYVCVPWNYGDHSAPGVD